MDKPKLHLLQVMALMSLGIASCWSSPVQRAAMTATAGTAIAASWTATPEPTETSTPTFSPTATLTPTSSPTATSTRIPTRTLTPTATHDPERWYSTDSLFSIEKLDRWTTYGDRSDEWEELDGPFVDGGSLFLLFHVQKLGLPSAMTAAFTQDKFAEDMDNYKELNEDTFKTDEGYDYFRWDFTRRLDGATVYSIGYVFFSGEVNVVALYTRPYGTGKSFDELVDSAMRSFRFEKKK